MKTALKINEQDMRTLVTECMKKLLKEDHYGNPDDLQDENLSGESDIQLSQKDLSGFAGTVPGGRRLVKALPNGISVRVYYSSYGSDDIDVHSVKITDRNVDLSPEQRQALEGYFTEYARTGGFNEYILGEVGDDFEETEMFGNDGPIGHGELGHGSDEAWVGDEGRPERFIGGAY